MKLAHKQTRGGYTHGVLTIESHTRPPARETGGIHQTETSHLIIGLCGWGGFAGFAVEQLYRRASQKRVGEIKDKNRNTFLHSSDTSSTFLPFCAISILRPRTHASLGKYIAPIAFVQQWKTILVPHEGWRLESVSFRNFKVVEPFFLAPSEFWSSRPPPSSVPSRLSSRFQKMPNGSLLIIDVTTDDTGRYTCVAGNSCSIKDRVAQLYVVGECDTQTVHGHTNIYIYIYTQASFIRNKGAHMGIRCNHK